MVCGSMFYCRYLEVLYMSWCYILLKDYTSSSNPSSLLFAYNVWWLQFTQYCWCCIHVPNLKLTGLCRIVYADGSCDHWVWFDLKVKGRTQSEYKCFELSSSAILNMIPLESCLRIIAYTSKLSTLRFALSFFFFLKNQVCSQHCTKSMEATIVSELVVDQF